MGKFSNNNMTVLKLSLSQLTEQTGNVRKEYDWEEIKNLAKSIQEHGLLNPITVKPGVLDDKTGSLKYEIVCGHRRIRAIQELQKQGVDIGLIECCVRTGNTWTLQMVENIQRTELSAQDKEQAISEMLKKGLSQKEIADMLAKPISYVSDIVAGTKVREQAEAAGIDTSSLKTRALAQLRSVDAEDLPGKVQELNEAGGTNAAATKILHDYKAETNDSEIEAPDFDEMIEPSSMSEADFYESENSTTHVSNEEISIINLPHSSEPLTVGRLIKALQRIDPAKNVCIKANGSLFEVHYVATSKDNLFFTTYPEEIYQKI